MPKVIPLDTKGKFKYQKELMTFRTEQQLLKYRIKKKDIAELTGVSLPAVSQQFSSRSITFDTYIAVNMLVEQKENGRE